MQHAVNACGPVAQQIANPRELEASLLLKAAPRLQAVCDGLSRTRGNLDEAPPYNRKLWSAQILHQAAIAASRHGICTNSLSWASVSGWLMNLNLMASGMRSLKPTTRSGMTISLGSNSSRMRCASSMLMPAKAA
jgi:flagellar protein FlaF